LRNLGISAVERPRPRRRVGLRRARPAVVPDLFSHGVGQQVDDVHQRTIDHFSGLRCPGLRVRLQRHVELVALEVTAPSDLVGGFGDDARAHGREHVRYLVVEVLVEEPLRVRAVTGREHAVARLVDDTEVAGVDEFVPQPLDEESLDVLQGLPGTDDDGQPVLVQLVEPVEDVAGDLVVRLASGPQRLVDVEDEGVDRSFVLGGEVQGRERLVAAQRGREVGVHASLLVEPVTDLRLPPLEFVGRLLPVVERHARIDGREQVDEVLVGLQGLRVEVPVEPIDLVVPFHTSGDGTAPDNDGVRGRRYRPVAL
jgi:hypothetical protein